MPRFALAAKTPNRFALATLVLLAGASHAQALEGKALFEKLLAQAGPKPVTVTYGSVSESGPASFAAQNVSLKVEGISQPFTIEALTVRGLREKAEGRVSYDAFAISQLAQKTDRGSMAIEGIASSNGDFPVIVLKGSSSAFQPGQAVKFDSFSLSGLSGSNNRNDSTFSLDSIAATKGDIPLVYDYEGKRGLKTDQTLQLESFAMNGIAASGSGSTVTVETVGISSLNVPIVAAGSALAFMTPFSGMFVKSVEVKTNGQTLMTMGDMNVAITNDGGDTYVGKGSFNDVKFEVAGLPERQARETMRRLGYETIEGSMTTTSSYNPKTGVTDLTNTVIDVKDMFAFAMDYKISGYTLEVAQQLQELSFKAEASGSDPTAQFMQMMPLLSQLKVDSMSLSLTDKSLVGKLLDMQAQQMGTSGEQLAAGAPMMLGMGMAGLGMPGLTEMVTSAVGKFLQQKGTLTASVIPANPVSVSDIMMASQTDPKKLPQMMNLQVTAD
ncbi:MAG: hypothetical protein AAF903_05760 [Pseudomonadota bacterium]